MAGREQWGAIRQLSSGRWQVRYRSVRGAKMIPAPKTFGTKTAARKWLRDTEAQLERGEFLDPRRGAISLRDYAVEWLDGRVLAETTREKYRRRLDSYILGTPLGDLPLSGITTPLVRQWYAKLARRIPSTASSTYRQLRGMLNTAVEDGRIRRNPCTLDDTRHNAPEREIGLPAQIVEAAMLMPEHYRALVLLACWAGLRRGELIGLRRRDIYPEDSVIVVRHTITWAGGAMVEKGPKTEAGGRQVTVPALVMAVVVEHLVDHAGSGPDGLVFPNTRGRPSHPASIYRHWHEARKAVGRPDLRMHDLRHSGSTFASHSGATLAEAMKRFGWRSVSTAMTYHHSTDPRQRELAERMNEDLAGVAEVIRLRPRTTAADAPAGAKGARKGARGAAEASQLWHGGGTEAAKGS